MDHLELRKLRLLEALESNQVLSQRELAQKLDISLGLVNSFIRRLAKKGYFKITTIPKNRVKYILTPKGIAEKSKLTYEYINYSLHFYKDTRLKLKQKFEDLQQEGVNKIAIHGTGHFAEIAFISLKETDIELVAVIDGNNAGKHFMGYLVDIPQNLKNYKFDYLLDTCFRDDDLRQMFEMGLPEEHVINLT